MPGSVDEPMTALEFRDLWEQQWNTVLRPEHRESFLRHEMIDRILTFGRQEIIAALAESRKLNQVELILWRNQKDRTKAALRSDESCPACGFSEVNCVC